MRHDNIDASLSAADNGDCVHRKCDNCRRHVHHEFHSLNRNGNALECPWCVGDVGGLIELADHMATCSMCAETWSDV